MLGSLFACLSVSCTVGREILGSFGLPWSYGSPTLNVYASLERFDKTIAVVYYDTTSIGWCLGKEAAEPGPAEEVQHPNNDCSNF